MSKKIVFNIFTPFYPPHIGGIETFTQKIVAELAVRDYQLNLIIMNYEKKDFIEKPTPNITIYRLSYLPLINDRFPLPFNFYQFIKIYQLCYQKKLKNKSTHNQQFTIANTRFYPSTFLALFLSKLNGHHSTIIEHGSSHLIMGNNFLDKIIALYEHMNSFILNLFHPQYYGVSIAASKWLNHFGLSSSGEICNGIDLKNTKLKTVSRSKNTIFYAGRLIPEKGIINLIEAIILFNKSNDQLNKLNLRIAGTGPLSAEIIEFQKKHPEIIFLGSLNSAQIIEELQSVTALFYPSSYPEGLPTIIIEAGSLGTPVFSTAKGGIPELIIHLQSGYILDSASQTDLNTALLYLSKNQSKLAVFGQNLQSQIIQNYDIVQIVNKLITQVQKNEKSY